MMGKNSKKKDVKVSKTSALKSSRALKKTFRSTKRCVSGTQEESSSICPSSADRCLGTASSCYTLLKDMCLHATLFQRHSHRDKLLASDVQKASDLYPLKNQSCFIHEKRNNVELSSCIEKTIDVKEAEKTFYYGKCLNSLELTDVKHTDIDQFLKDYFEFTMKAVLVNNSELFTMLLSDLKKNLSILPILPVFIHTICNEAFLIKHKTAHLKKFLMVIHSLYLNQNLYFQNEYLHKILDFVIVCAITSFSSRNQRPEDVLSLQDTSTEILHDIFIKNHSLSVHVYKYILEKLALPFRETTFQLISCCGSLTVINVMGLSAISFILPLIFFDVSQKFLNILNESLNSNNMYVQKYSKIVQKKLFEACQNFVQYSLHKALTLPNICNMYKVNSTKHDKLSKNKTDGPSLNVELCCAILRYYGEMMSSCLPPLLNASNKAVSVTELFNLIQQKNEEKIIEL